MAGKIKFIIAKNIGFCSGAKRAILITEKALKNSPRPIQFLRSLLHNEAVIDRLKRKGVMFVSDPKKLKPGTLVIQAHGISPLCGEVEKKLSIRDTTCPRVKKAQLIANSLFEKGYQVVIVGDKNHSETKGIKGYAQNKAVVVENEKQAGKLPKFKKIGVVCQTTQNLDNVRKVLKVLRRKNKNIKFINTLCPEVQARQKELSQIMKKAEGILVVGSRLSANTRRLAERVKKQGKKLIWANSLKDLERKKLKGVSLLGVVSGASAPDWEIEKIRKYFKQHD